MRSDIRALCIFGPTASGKSALALALAETHGGVVVNADSMQVYRDLRVITARPDAAEEARAPHALYGHVDAAERHSVGRWLEDAARAIAQAREDGRLAILVGGTGLYFKALTEGLAPAPSIPEAIRTRLADDLARLGAPALHARLKTVDPAIAERLAPADAPRILRALEVAEAGEARLSDLHAQTKPVLAPNAWAGLALAPDRARLYAAIDARAEAMLASGAVEEVAALAARGLDPRLPAMKAHGVPHIAAWLRGERARSDALAAMQADTRHYAKRQFTWMRGQLPDWPRIETESLSQRVAIADGWIGASRRA